MSNETAVLSRSAYNALVKEAKNEASLRNAEANLASFQSKHKEAVLLLRALRQVHLDHCNSPGVGHVAQAVSDQEFSVSQLRREIKDTESLISRLEGNVEVLANDEDE